MQISISSFKRQKILKLTPNLLIEMSVHDTLCLQKSVMRK
jgi:hypothetical protein